MTVTVLLQVSVSFLPLYKTREEAVKKTMEGGIEIIR